MNEETDKKQRRQRGQVIPLGNGVFKVRVPLSDAAGKRSYHNKTLHNTTEPKAWKYVNNVLAKTDDGTFFVPSKETVEVLLKRWLNHVARQGVRQITLDTYSIYTKIYLNPALGSIPLAQLTSLKIQDAFDAMVDRGLAPLTIRNARRILDRALTKAVKWNKLRDNPAASLETPKGKRRKQYAMNENQAAAFLAMAKEQPEDLIFILVLCTGLRPAEFIGLRWCDIEVVQDTDARSTQTIERGLLHVQRTIIRPRGGGWIWSDPKTENSVRDVYFPVAIYHELMNYKARQDEQKRLMGTAYHDNELVFAQPDGEPLERGLLTRTRFKPLLRRAKLPEEFNLYTLRRSFATLATAAGASRLGRSVQMGHADPNFTDEVYVTILPSMQKSVADALENLLFSDFRTLSAHEHAERVM